MMWILLNFPIYKPFNPLRVSKPFSCHGTIPEIYRGGHFQTAITRRLEEIINVLKYQLEPWPPPEFNDVNFAEFPDLWTI
jgi:hypothetical protein